MSCSLERGNTENKGEEGHGRARKDYRSCKGSLSYDKHYKI